MIPFFQAPYFINEQTQKDVGDILSDDSLIRQMESKDKLNGIIQIGDEDKAIDGTFVFF